MLLVFTNRSRIPLSLLSQVWDHFIPYFAAHVSKPFSNASIDPFFSGLVSRIHAGDEGKFLSQPKSWLSCIDPSTPEKCAELWAKESNKWDCDYVWSKVHNDTDLGTDGYALGAVPIVELQISKAALRLGTWLNALVASTKAKMKVQEIIEL